MHKLSAVLRSLFLSSWHPFASFAVIGFLVYGQALFFGFSYLDDHVLILEHLGDLTDFSRMGQIFQADVFRLAGQSESYYRPLLILSFMVNAFVGGAHPWGYHFVNIMIHVIAAGLVFALLLRMGFDRVKAFCLSLLFLIHPALTQAVAWIPGRNDSLLAVFILSSFLFFIHYVKTFRARDYWGHLVFFLCALLTKESAVVLPLMLGSYYFLVQKEKFLDFPLKVSVGWLGCFCFWFVLRMRVIHTDALLLRDGIASIATNSPAVLLYLGKVFFPFNLCVFPILPDSHFWYGALSAITIAALIVFSKEKNGRMLFFGFLWFFVFLVFALMRLAQKADSPDFLEHRLYVPMIGLIFVLAELKPFSFFAYRKVLMRFVFVTVFCVFLVMNVTYVQHFKDRVLFWQNAVHCSPHSAFAHGNMGAMYFLEGKEEAAVYEYAKALYLNPKQKMIYNNFGLIFMRQQKWREAQKAFLKEIDINPRYADAYYNFGLLCYRQGKKEQARQLMQKALKINPDFISAYEALAVDFYQQGDEPKARYYFEELKKRKVYVSKEMLDNLAL